MEKGEAKSILSEAKEFLRKMEVHNELLEEKYKSIKKRDELLKNRQESLNKKLEQTKMTANKDFLNLIFKAIGTNGLLFSTLFLFPHTASSFYSTITIFIVNILVVSFVLSNGVKLVNYVPSINLAATMVLLFALNIIIFYANVYYDIYSFDNSSFSHFTQLDSLYYSITTFTTTGYGDIIPQGGFAKIVASTEMLVGLTFSTTTMAVLAARLSKSIF